MSQIKVAIADDHPLFRAALTQAVLKNVNSVEVLEAENFQDLISVVENNPDIEIIFLDLHMPGNDGFTGLTLLQNHFPDIVVIMVSSDDQLEIIRKAINLGASAFIPKSASLTQISTAIATVLEGEVWLPEHTDINADQQTAAEYQRLAKQLAQLTPQQYTVLASIANGRLNKQIAYDLDIKETTVKKHVSAILVKLEVYNRTQAGLVFQQLMLTANENQPVTA
ncbi:response regulator transcription factor [Shewanella sp. CG12_big_fil_rev_8_21_14_0_65_47_15]|uniref:response regulator transcription factor n=1 Tax=Shewanella sp. CG12_big_fil_rev_8_21_14_0_65_47_15 TaxID=1975537 RepID=UPI000CBF8B5A|nr:response regulator transcription factor [Shewanella sp. CG12_big_fil_rev_8_21_14_0_65_47_15]PIW62077.1 MAG: DNA-binding response regulator [Shewanella sp. CG12_big_fil_rev_8_21_14_0_65_47_15]